MTVDASRTAKKSVQSWIAIRCHYSSSRVRLVSLRLHNKIPLTNSYIIFSMGLTLLFRRVSEERREKYLLNHV